MDRPASTPRRLLGLLRDGPQTAQHLAGRLGLDVSSVRRHLDGLTMRGWVGHEDHAEGPGRPKRRYHLTQEGRESFPRDYALLLDALLDKLQARVGRPAVLAAFADVGADLAASLPHPRGPQDPQARMEALLDLYVGLGFEASLEHDGARTDLVQRNCPFLRTARADPEALCDCLDEGILRAALPGARIRLRQCMATGDALCRHEILPRGP